MLYSAEEFARLVNAEDLELSKRAASVEASEDVWLAVSNDTLRSDLLSR
jgi:hypothetical protein